MACPAGNHIGPPRFALCYLDDEDRDGWQAAQGRMICQECAGVLTAAELVRYGNMHATYRDKLACWQQVPPNPPPLAPQQNG